MNLIEPLQIEVLSPAGDEECLRSALHFGADAVYLAGEMFGMRTCPSNFKDDELSKAVKCAHEHNAKVYVCCNTLPRNSEIEMLPSFLEFVESCGADALIIADMGVLSLARKYAPHVDIHISTQFGVSNYVAARELYDMGASRVVLARELSLEEISCIREKTNKHLELEAFVHGSMCMSYSGRCLISAYLTGRDANRGDCTQPCRWEYALMEKSREGQYFPIIEDTDGTYFFNSKDMCMIDHIPELVNAGVSSLKIEGRAKSSYYVSTITNAYKCAAKSYIKAISDGTQSFRLAPWILSEVNKVSHREYSTGFFFGNEPGQVYSNGGYVREYDVVAVCEGVYADKVHVSQRNKFSLGDTLNVLEPGIEPYDIEVTGMSDVQGNPVDVANHAMQSLFLLINRRVAQGAVFRKKR